MRSILYIILSILALVNVAHSQPKIQQTSIWAPANIKIDGNATEWNNQFQAYNKATNVYYTIANDDKNLYLAIQATDQNIIKKIVQGAITLAINTSGKKDDKNNLTVTFPKYDKKNPPFYIILNKIPKTADSIKYKISADSSMNKYNKQLNDRFKIIGITGIKGITDSIISIYTEDGIKAVARFDNNIYYNFELALPIKYLPVNHSGGLTSFRYNIKLNGPMGNGGSVHTIPGRNVLTFTGNDGVNYTIGASIPENMDFAFPTDFWGEYVLARK